VPLAETHHVVVDGSNLATEGRTFPSLEQLDEAVRAYASEDPGASIIVVVDATFEHRVSDAEREEVRQAMLNGEVISPPAGAIGRGDAFVLRIAERTGATVLSNDSFQEFHGEHPWLFDDGRLVGGKPVPGVGWIFTPRLPIRGPKSRAATAEAKAKKDPESAPAKAAELAKAAKKAAKNASKAQKSAKQKAPPVDTTWPLTPTAPPPGRDKVDPVFSSAIDEALEEAMHPPPPQKSRSAAKKHAAAKKAAPPKSAKVKKDTTVGRTSAHKSSQPKAERAARQRPGRTQKKRSAPPPAVNEPLTFINFVAAFTVGSTIDGEVVSFTSHGAMVDVPLPGGGALHCYIPLTAMGTPPPTKARQVLKKGEVRPFVLAGLDPPRRVAELALPPAESIAPKRTAAKKAVPATKRASSTKVAPSTKKAAAKKAPSPAKKATKKATATAKKAPKKAAVKKVAKKATQARQSPTKKSSAKKAAKARQR
jgi:Zc3h12a-like Ribonuclease NYN domain